MNCSVAFLLGLLGSLHCAAMCGPLQLALPMPPGGGGRVMAGRLIYQVGRSVTYGMLGVIGGMIGRSVYLAGLQRWLSITLGLAVFAGFLVSHRLAISAPVTRFVLKLKSAMSAQLRQRGFRSLGLLGMLNGLLPCGLVYAALAGAIAQGDWLAGGVYMLIFGLGTWPMMFALSLSGKMLPPGLRRRLAGAIPVGVCLLAGLLILRGLALGIPYLSPGLALGTDSCCAH
jgi:sulfite exporter TauE/SafE